MSGSYSTHNLDLNLQRKKYLKLVIKDYIVNVIALMRHFSEIKSTNIIGLSAYRDIWVYKGFHSKVNNIINMKIYA